MLTASGVCRIDSGVDAMSRYTAAKNIKLFSDLKVTWLDAFLSALLFSGCLTLVWLNFRSSGVVAWRVRRSSVSLPSPLCRARWNRGEMHDWYDSAARHTFAEGAQESSYLVLVKCIALSVVSHQAAQVGPVPALSNAVGTLQSALGAIHAATSDEAKAALARSLRLEEMLRVRELCDEAEAVCPAHLWTLATYKELQFMVRFLWNCSFCDALFA
jgi:hypothetical protein